MKRSVKVQYGFRTILGIDQTGAVEKSGLPKPLYAAAFTLSDMRLTPNLKLSSLTHAAVTALIGKHNFPVLLLVDSALGMPQSLGADIRTLLRSAATFSFAGKAFGATVAYEFFLTFLQKNERENLVAPKRLAESLAGANSVFSLRPFQRNVGCGTYRVLKELGNDQDWFRIWPHEAFETTANMIVEGYPSLMWRDLLQVSSRSQQRLNSWLDIHYQGTPHPRTPDDADAAVLALGGWKLLQNGYFDEARSGVMMTEGWIAGLKLDRPFITTHSKAQQASHSPS